MRNFRAARTFFVNISLAGISFPYARTSPLGYSLYMNSFSLTFPLDEFFCTSPPPPPRHPHNFSNGPSLKITAEVLIRRGSWDIWFKMAARGVEKEVLRAGSGSPPKRGDTITVHCTGSLNTNPPKKFWRYLSLYRYCKLIKYLMSTFGLYMFEILHAREMQGLFSGYM